MKKGILLTGIVAICLLTVTNLAHAQYFRFDNLDKKTAELEVEGILKLFGSLVGGGLYHTADMHNFGGFDIGLRGVLADVPDEFAGLPIFAEENRIGLAFLHGSIGLPANLELIGRFFYMPLGADQDLNATPARANDSRGGVTLIGGGLKYGLLQRTSLPKIMLMGTYHALLVPDEFDFGTVGTLSFNAVVSHSIAILAAYVGVGVDITTLTVNDDSPILPGKSFTEEAVHYSIGARITPLPYVYLNGSINFGEFNSFDLGLGLSFR